MTQYEANRQKDIPIEQSGNEARERRKTYQAHRERQRAGILEAARKLFIERGIEKITMTEILSAADVSRATLYQYFTNREDIAWAILEDIFGSLLSPEDGIQQLLDPARGTGFERIEAFFLLMVESLINNPDQFRFIAQFDYVYAASGESQRMIELERHIFQGGDGFMSVIVRQGMDDGSLRSDLDPVLTSAALMNVLVAILSRLAFMRANVEAEYGFQVEKILREFCRLMLQGIRAV